MIYRLYFNRTEDFPQVWSIDEGTPDTEVNVVGFRFEGAMPVTSGVSTDGTQPRAWVSIDAKGLSIEHGIAVFEK